MSFKSELLQAIHDFSSDVFKLALYDSDASLSSATTAYSTTNEVSGSGYSAGGATLTAGTVTTSGQKVYVTFDDETFSTVTISPVGGLIYNSSKADRAVAVLSFGTARTKTAADLVINFPDELIRIE